MKTPPITKELKFSKTLVVTLLVICIIPFILQLAGVNFGSINVVLDASGDKVVLDDASQNLILTHLRGTFTHLILEWTAICIAVSTAILAFIQYRITNNPTTPIIGAALLCAGFIDGFHALAAVNIIDSASTNDNFLPFTWALSRIFNSVILIIGASIFLIKEKRMIPKRGRRFVLLVSLFFVLLAYLTMYFVASSKSLPITTFHNSFVTRPYDLISLILFLFMAIYLFPKLNKKENSVFSNTLLWSMIPAIATQMYMAFGSENLHDSNFNIAHTLKAISYAIPFIGIMLDYISAHKKEQIRVTALKNAHYVVSQKNKELEQFAFIASHDLQEPLRTLLNFTQLFKEEYADKLDENGKTYLNFIRQATTRMSLLIKAVFDYSRIGVKNNVTKVKTNKLVKNIIAEIQPNLNDINATIKHKKLPKIYGQKTELRILFQNLIGNAIKFQKKGNAPVVEIQGKDIGEYWEFSVKDNGIGIEKKHQDKIFSMFQRLHSKDIYDGVGIGLAHCLKIVLMHEGRIWVISEPNKGSEFKFTIKKQK
ncbi:two-component sensor histidine kinase [Cellulophaga lytica]|uniref:histidine kinase n=2 Tax=Cellulophaga TaxID=104264 RepID=F0RGM4_CELLC|nr:MULTISPECIES: ATP-binding protein [Cellulophaga]ADY28049.1 integral membrane sensor signal transduction histidine kinase [Cellulophaga lytica DSM 7489]EWH14205.1 integral membrane sensor signal transduction histidine kinase [Cellulophaga geojensis KL-A]MDO6854262.1 ATP-binding protein [Cellulophaga lytica]TVZ09381.1 phospho-acceptor domain-containing protein [Cellulophaga sp. RHA_52]WQG77762.1 ATP-binding protein [Cellulophaga lytica]